MSDDRGHSELTLALVFLAGALVGAGVALLVAPQSGAETREKVADWAKRAQEKAREAAAGIQSAARGES
ncbi:MAG: YtxH domain-containing protein [Acidobacteria bacterium]|nr:YtxH domain-containing protein [Acidobacteriota bacterium]